MVKAAFAQRRKTAVNSIASGMGLSKTAVAEALAQRIVDNNFKFTISEKTKRNLESVIDESNNTVKFLQDSSFVELGSSYEESSANLYSAYKCWCAINLLEALSQNAFTRQLKSNSAKLGIEYTTHIKQGKGEVRGFRGIHAINKLYYCY